MNKEQIDEVLNAIETRNIKKIISISGVSVTNNKMFISALKNIMLKIEQGDYEYFYSLICNLKHIHTVSLLLCYSTKTNDIKYLIENAKKLGIGPNVIKDLIISTKDSEYIKQIIEDKCKMKQLGVNNNYCIVEFIKATKDANYIKSIIENKERRKELGIYKFNMKDLIISIDDKDYIKELVDNENKREQMDINDFFIDLILMLDEPEYIDLLYKKMENSDNIGMGNNRINLPSNMTIGIEIESEGLYSHLIKSIQEGWKLANDISLNNGIEAKSPILTEDLEKATEEIKTVCKRLKLLRTNFIRTMWRTCTYWSKLFNNK